MKTVMDPNKMHHIFRNAPGHMPILGPFISAAGGKIEAVEQVYKKLNDLGHLNGLSLNLPNAETINVLGTSIKATFIRLSDGSIRVSDFWVP